MFLNIGSITLKLHWVCIDIFNAFETAPVLPLLEAKVLSSYIESFENTIAGLYSISLAICHINCIFWDVILFCLTF